MSGKSLKSTASESEEKNNSANVSIAETLLFGEVPASDSDNSSADTIQREIEELADGMNDVNQNSMDTIKNNLNVVKNGIPAFNQNVAVINIDGDGK